MTSPVSPTIQNPSSEPFRFSTKAETLARLQGRLTKGKLCKQLIIHAGIWGNDRENQISAILKKFGKNTLIVRSSAGSEDTWDNSLAGAYLSIADVTPTKADIADAVDQVFASYKLRSDNDQVLIQPMVRDVALSGVVLTRDLDTGSPYYVVNYDDLTGRTDTVTGGLDSTTMLIRRAGTESLKSPRIRKLIECIMELEQITGQHELDVEFCITKNEDVFIFQMRPLSARSQWSALGDDTVDTAIEDIRISIFDHMKPKPGLGGASTIFTEMTDWNPAEMIGNTPRPLALSLYKSLITDRIWADARQAMGYQHVPGPLLIDFYGRPYIDVRKSFNSFIPANISSGIVHTLVNHQLSQLSENRDLHDKVEFEICVTCWDFSQDIARKRFRDASLSDTAAKELEEALRSFTQSILISGAEGLYPLLGTANSLLENQEDLDHLPPIEQIEQLLHSCREKGTLSFSQLARHGFIGVQFLKSLVERDAFTTDEMECFMHSIATVATSLANDLHTVISGSMDRDEFLSLYGHLRPGTYDILSWRYDERPDLYLGHGGHPTTVITHPSFTLSENARHKIDRLLSENGYDISANHLLEYIAAAIKGREQAKFAFTRMISNTLSELAAWGKTLGLSRDDLSFLPIKTILQQSDVNSLKKQIETARNRYSLTRALRLPHVIDSNNDVDVVRLPMGQPTFITSKTVTAKTRVLTSIDAPDIDDRIVLIESADPGFDWIFSHDIRGLITKFGGANSHMAIRCAEFGLPAAIGCGERLFNTLSKANVIELNASAKRVNIN